MSWLEKLIEIIPAVLKEIAESPIGLIGLICFLLSIVICVLFHKAEGNQRLIAFGFLSASALLLAVMGTQSYKTVAATSAAVSTIKPISSIEQSSATILSPAENKTSPQNIPTQEQPNKSIAKIENARLFGIHSDPSGVWKSNSSAMKSSGNSSGEILLGQAERGCLFFNESDWTPRPVTGDALRAQNERMEVLRRRGSSLVIQPIDAAMPKSATQLFGQYHVKSDVMDRVLSSAIRSVVTRTGVSREWIQVDPDPGDRVAEKVVNGSVCAVRIIEHLLSDCHGAVMEQRKGTVRQKCEGLVDPIFGTDRWTQ